MILKYSNGVYLEEKVSCEIREWPSMMWKKCIVQAGAATRRACSACALRTVLLVLVAAVSVAAPLNLCVTMFYYQNY